MSGITVINLTPPSEFPDQDNVETVMLGDASGSFFITGSDSDYALVNGFNFPYDRIELSGGDDYSIEYIDGINHLYKITGGAHELIAKIPYASSFDINMNFFDYLY